MNYELLLLDFDGTLVDTRGAITACLQATFEEFGRTPPTAERIQALIGMNLKRTMQAHAPDLGDEEAQKWVLRYRELYGRLGRDLSRPYPLVVETLEKLHHAGVTMAALSNKGHQQLIDSLEHLGMMRFMSLVSGDRLERPAKPDASVVHEEVRGAFPDVALDRMLVVGDGEQDAQLAENAGVACCWVSYGCGDRAKCLAHGPKYVIDHFAQLEAVVLGHAARERMLKDSQQVQRRRT